MFPRYIPICRTKGYLLLNIMVHLLGTILLTKFSSVLQVSLLVKFKKVLIHLILNDILVFKLVGGRRGLATSFYRNIVNVHQTTCQHDALKAGDQYSLDHDLHHLLKLNTPPQKVSFWQSCGHQIMLNYLFQDVQT